MATVTASPTVKFSGGSFLIEERTPQEVFTPEDFTEQHLLIAQTAEEFATKEIVPNIEKMEHKEFAINRELVKRAGELGLSGVDIPEQYGGLQLDKVTSAIIADRLAKHGGFSTTWGAHTCIGTLPIVYFGTEEQKKKYLPGLASGTTVGAYALSESSSGSDALNCRPVYCVCEGRWLEVHGVYSRAYVPGLCGWRRRAQNGNSRLIHLPSDSQ